MLNRVLLLRNYTNERGVRPGDFLCVVRDVALDGSSDGTIDLSGVVRKGATVYLKVYEKLTTNATTGILTVNADVSLASATHTALIYFLAKDIAQAGE